MNLTSKVTGLNKATNKIRAIGTVLKKPARELLTQEARLVAISCAKSSQPFGTGKSAQSLGQGAVNRDIRKVYRTPGDAFSSFSVPLKARGFWKALKSGNLARAQTILNRDAGSDIRGLPLKPFDAGAAHKSARSAATGRVNQKKPSMIVTNARALSSYIAKKQDLVGFAKSAWTTIARKLVSSGAIRGLKAAGDISATWISGKSAPGDVTWSGDDKSPVVTLTSRVNYASQVLPKAARDAAVAIARGRLAKSLEIAAKAELKKLDRAA